jgi:hypothetical protein
LSKKQVEKYKLTKDRKRGHSAVLPMQGGENVPLLLIIV